MANCLIGLGSNLGDRGANLQGALSHLANLPQTKLVAQSSFRDTNPAGGPVQDPYLNAAATIETSLSPQQLLAELQRIENGLGRVRTEHWGPRTIDLDLLLYDRLELNSPELTLPHPRMSFRRFVLEPAAEIAAEMVYPINGWTIARLLRHSQTSATDIHLSPGPTARFTQSRATELLDALVAEPYVQPLYQRQVDSWDFDDPTIPHRENANWAISDLWTIQILFEQLANDSDFDAVIAEVLKTETGIRLVVVWQPGSSQMMRLLDRVRHNPECPPVLWIPSVTLEQARQEVIAAMAAME